MNSFNYKYGNHDVSYGLKQSVRAALKRKAIWQEREMAARADGNKAAVKFAQEMQALEEEIALDEGYMVTR